MNRRKKIIIALLLIGLGAIEFPGVFFIKNQVHPFIFGFPFIYGYVILWWAYLCCVLFYAYKTGWGRKPFISRDSG